MGQDEADRSEYLKARVDGATPGVGVARLRAVADAANMQALSGVTEDDVCMVRGAGLYVALGSNRGVQSPFQYASVGTANIWWYWVGLFGLDDQLGTALVVTDGVTEKLLRPDVVPSRIVADEVVAGGTVATEIDHITDNTTERYLQSSYGGADISLSLGNLKNGDVVTVEASFVAVCGTGLQARLDVYYATASHYADGSHINVAPAAAEQLHLIGRHTIVGDQTGVVAKVKIKNSASPATNTLYGQYIVRAQVVRP